MENIYNSELEIRYVSEIRASVDENLVKGSAIVFNSPSELLYGEFREIIKPEAITKEFLDTQDIVMLYNHNQDYGILARSKNGKGTLKYSVDETGVHFQFSPKKKDGGIVESLACGDLDACSFAFRISSEQGAEKWEKQTDGKYLRTISKFQSINDFSIVPVPAYPTTSVSMRALENFKEELRQQEEKQMQEIEQREKEKSETEQQAEEQKRKAEEQKKTQEFDKYYTALKKKYLNK